MTPAEFTYISGILKQRSGLALTEDKLYLLESRLKPLAREKGYETLSQLVAYMRANNSEELLRQITEAMTTNETMFFRDNKPFLRLKEAFLPTMLPKLTNKKLKILSAACSSGQEPYSLAMLFDEEKSKMNGCTYEITATDLDTQILKKAQEGLFTQFEVQRGLPIQMLVKNFEQKEGNQWQIKSHLKANINFRQYNLLDTKTVLGRFDLIFCRNVLIYFDEPTKRAVLERLASWLEPHGLLLLGSAETVIGITDKLKPLMGEPGIFSLPGN